jgi:hypothetical protein
MVETTSATPVFHSLASLLAALTGAADGLDSSLALVYDDGSWTITLTKTDGLAARAEGCTLIGALVRVMLDLNLEPEPDAAGSLAEAILHDPLLSAEHRSALIITHSVWQAIEVERARLALALSDES